MESSFAILSEHISLESALLKASTRNLNAVGRRPELHSSLRTRQARRRQSNTSGIHSVLLPQRILQVQDQTQIEISDVPADGRGPDK